MAYQQLQAQRPRSPRLREDNKQYQQVTKENRGLQGDLEPAINASASSLRSLGGAGTPGSRVDRPPAGFAQALAGRAGQDPADAWRIPRPAPGDSGASASGRP